jgi:hypothetical protein
MAGPRDGYNVVEVPAGIVVLADEALLTDWGAAVIWWSIPRPIFLIPP